MDSKRTQMIDSNTPVFFADNPICDHDFTLRRCSKCGVIHYDTKEEPTLIDWLGSKKMQRRLSAGTWGADHPKRMNFPTDSQPYESASKPIIPMPKHWYEKT
jgi:hypothetical protein